MFANKTEETCTGTGDTLELAGATSGNYAFSDSFSDGDQVSYYVEDSGGSIEVAGIGTYVSATDDITRKDTWNYNGTVFDTNPSSNIALSAGTHTVRCVIHKSVVGGMGRFKASTNSNIPTLPDNVSSLTTGNALTANFGYFMPALFHSEMVFSKLWIDVNTADASGTAEIGIFTVDDTGRPVSAIATAAPDITATGKKFTNLAGTEVLPPGRYAVGIVSNSSTATYDRFSTMSGGGHLGAYAFRSWTPSVLRLDLGQATFPTDLSTQGRFDTDPLVSAAIGFGT